MKRMLKYCTLLEKCRKKDSHTKTPANFLFNCHVLLKMLIKSYATAFIHSLCTNLVSKLRKKICISIPKLLISVIFKKKPENNSVSCDLYLKYECIDFS